MAGGGSVGSSRHENGSARCHRRQAEAGSDIVTGTRYVRGGGVFGWNFKRKLTSRGANYLAATLLQPGVGFHFAAECCTPSLFLA